MKQKHVTANLTFLFLGLIFLYSLTGNGDIFYPSFFIISSIFLMVKSKPISKKDVLIGIALGILSFNPIYGFCSVFAYIGAKSFFNSSANKIKAMPASVKSGAFYVLTGTLALSAINVIWMLADKTPLHISLNGNAVIMGLIAGIPEEILFRYLLFALCVYIAGDSCFTKSQSVLCGLIMVIPHVLKHYPSFSAIGFFDFLLMCLFGCAFTYIQKKSSLASAITVHFAVDFIRFTVFSM